MVEPSQESRNNQKWWKWDKVALFKHIWTFKLAKYGLFFNIYLVHLCYYRLNILEYSNFDVLWAIFSHFVSRYTSKMLKMAFSPLPRHAFWPLKWARVGIFWIFWARWICNWKIYNFWNFHPNKPKPAIFFKRSKLKVQKWGPLTL